MYIRLTRARFDPANYDEVRDIIGDVIDATQHQPGFYSYYTGVARAEGVFIAVSMWDTEEHARVSREDLGDTVPRLETAGVRLEEPEIYEMGTHS